MTRRTIPSATQGGAPDTACGLGSALESPAKPRWERRPEARPQELLAAALELFVERGFAGTRLDDVAQRAGVSKGTLYLYFANKQDLFKAVVRENIVPALDEAEAMIDSFEGPSRDLFRHFMLGWWERLGQSSVSGVPKLVMSEAGNFPELASFYYDEVIVRGQGMIERLIERGIAQGEFRQVDVPAVRNVLIAPVLMLTTWKHSFGRCGEDLNAPQYLQAFIDLALNGLQVC